MSPSTDPPLKPLVVDVLLALCEEPQHGYGLMKRLQRDAEKKVHTGPLYRMLRDLLEAGLVEELAQPPEGVSDDPRRGSYYAISAKGREVLADELGRLRSLVERGRSIGLVPG